MNTHNHTHNEETDKKHDHEHVAHVTHGAPGHSMKHDILDVIAKGRAKMAPRWFYIGKAALVTTGLILFALAIVYISSIIFFTIRFNGIWFLPAFGFSAMRTVFFSLPWVLILLATVFVMILIVLVRRYAFAYKRPIVYSVLGLTLIVLVAGFIMSKSVMHQKFVYRLHEGHPPFPFAGRIYMSADRPSVQRVYIGDIDSMVATGFILKERKGGSFNVLIDAETRLPYGEIFEVGNHVLVFGKGDVIINDGADITMPIKTIQAHGIRLVEDIPDRLPGMYPGMDRGGDQMRMKQELRGSGQGDVMYKVQMRSE